MGAAYFYHLTRARLEETLPLLLGKSLAAGWSVAVRGPDPDRLDWLDQALWQGPPDSFLPHGLAGGAHDALQPILLLGEGGTAANDPSCLMTVEGAEVTAEDVDAMERVCVLFDGNDQQAVQRARDQWKLLTSAGCKAQYWSEDSGRWEKKAES